MGGNPAHSPPTDPIAHTDGDVLNRAADWLRLGHAAAIATVVATWGSAPRPIGSRLAVRADGLFAGSVSGGCVEADVVAEALEAITDGRPRLLEFGVPDAVAWASGLSCGGHIVIRVEPIVTGVFAPQMLLDIVAALAARCASIRVVDFATGHEQLVLSSALPRDNPLGEDCAAVFAAGASRCIGTGDERRFFELTAPPVRLCIVGAVHIAQTLAPMAAMIGLDVTVIDPREAFASADRFAGARMIVGWPEDVLGRDHVLDPATAMVALAHRPEIDDPAISAALEAGCFYVGALGSRKSHARRVERLTAGGIAKSAIARLHAPIGLSIGATSPAEIAVSVLAEIVSQMRRTPDP